VSFLFDGWLVDVAGSGQGIAIILAMTRSADALPERPAPSPQAEGGGKTTLVMITLATRRRAARRLVGQRRGAEKALFAYARSGGLHGLASARL
jgi:hypothetical protein